MHERATVTVPSPEVESGRSGRQAPSCTAHDVPAPGRVGPSRSLAVRPAPDEGLPRQETCRHARPRVRGDRLGHRIRGPDPCRAPRHASPSGRAARARRRRRKAGHGGLIAPVPLVASEGRSSCRDPSRSPGTARRSGGRDRGRRRRRARPAGGSAPFPAPSGFEVPWTWERSERAERSRTSREHRGEVAGVGCPSGRDTRVGEGPAGDAAGSPARSTRARPAAGVRRRAALDIRRTVGARERVAFPGRRRAGTRLVRRTMPDVRGAADGSRRRGPGSGMPVVHRSGGAGRSYRQATPDRARERLAALDDPARLVARSPCARAVATARRLEPDSRRCCSR